MSDGSAATPPDADDRGAVPSTASVPSPPPPPQPPRPPVGSGPARSAQGVGAVAGWPGEVAAELARMGLAVRVGYPVGPWTVDLVVGDGQDAVAVEAGVHPEGVAAHLERHRVLRGAGWRVVDAHPTRFDGSAARAALHLAQDLATP